MKIRCTTLFDISKTDISDRRGLLDQSFDPSKNKQRNQQRNFETILQIISMRSQPENVSIPVITHKNHLSWGLEYSKKISSFWHFTFDVSHSAVFFDGENELGNLFADCQSVPMITGLDESASLSPQLDVTTKFKNIHFEVVNHD